MSMLEYEKHGFGCYCISSTLERSSIPNIFDQDFDLNVWRNHRLNNDSLWLTFDMTVMKMKDMSTLHIQNCIEMLDAAIDMDYIDTKAYKGLKSELLKRQGKHEH